MTIKGIVFDIGGVLEITPDLGVNEKWEQRLQLAPGDFNKKLYDVWRGGSIGTMTLAEVEQGIASGLNLSDETVSEIMEDIWTEYLGTLNVELLEYFRSLRPEYKTAILSNSFVGAREREQAAYGFEDACDFIIYSHEVGMSKPDPRIYALTCERLGLAPHEVIFLDDRDGAIEAANTAGMHGIIFKDNRQAIADIEACIRENISIV